MRLYHGSNIEIQIPDLAKSKPYKDFGKGFYLTEDVCQAERMAKLRSSFMGGTPVVSTFEFDESTMKGTDLKTLCFNEYNEEWAKFVMDNRDIQIEQPCHQFDIVYGLIADDGVTYQLRRCKAGVISIEQLVKELKYSAGITFQYYFGTERVLQKLKRI